MYQIAAASFLTWVVSYLSTTIIKNSIAKIKGTQWLKHGDQICRGGILGFVLTQVLPNVTAHFGISYTILALGSVLLLLSGIEKIYQHTCQQSNIQSSAVLSYLLLLPHCFLEGFAAAPYL